MEAAQAAQAALGAQAAKRDAAQREARLLLEERADGCEAKARPSVHCMVHQVVRCIMPMAARPRREGGGAGFGWR